MPNTNPQVDAYLNDAGSWKAELVELRKILLRLPLVEELKWGKPCYTFEGGNVVIFQGFKDACALMFFKGALLKDAKGLLEMPGENTQAARRILFTEARQVVKLGPTLKAYLQEAIEVEKAGLEVAFKKTPEPAPEELQQKFDADPSFKKAFEALTPGRQRAYILHFAAATQSKTRVSRIEKCAARILAGKGLSD